ncbi:uncharacterized protein [Nicotiana tomentosiformis]|uniref:uncharacterized protein n=1 Tax=Nicotiana tomentosiformis TaxID=4098 RepID=UPI00388C807E
MWGSEEDKILAGMRKLFLDEESMDYSAIVKEDEEEDLTIQIIDSKDLEDNVIPEEIVKEVENFENKPKSNLEETEAINLGDSEIINETRISIHLSPIEKEEYISGATYMRSMTTIFYDMIHKEIEVYVDDVIIKSKRSSDHIADLKKFFNRLRKYNLKLNPAKCAFGVPAGKLLGFIVSRRGIELDPSKIKVIQDLPPPKNKKDKVVKGKALADYLAENPVDGEYEPLKTYFLDEEVSFVGEDITEAYDGWRMFFDRAANFKGVGNKVDLVSETGQHYPVSAKLRFPYTNNIAEYEAYILGLRLAIDMNIQELLRFVKIEFKHVPRIQNEFADALATLSSMIRHPDKNFIDPILIGIHKQPAYCARVEEEFDENSWFRDIKEYLEKGEYPKNATHT